MTIHESEVSPELVTDLIIQSVTDAFRIMINSRVDAVDTSLHCDSDGFFPITAVIGLAGEIAGSVCLSMSPVAATTLINRYLGITVEANSSLVLDGVGELANVIVGSARNNLQDYSLQLGLPTMVLGQNVGIMFPSSATPKCIRYASEIGDLKVVVGLQRRLRLPVRSV